jgi:hypothetical protein
MKMLVVGLAIAAAAVGGGLGYAGMQTSTLPDWYSQVATRENVANPDSGGTFPEVTKSARRRLMKTAIRRILAPGQQAKMCWA